jgi:hypothetical protein
MTAPVLPLRGVITSGLRDLVRLRAVVFPVYLVNLGIALGAIFPLYVALHGLTAHRPAAEALVERWDVAVLAELVMDHPDLLAQLKGSFLWALLAMLLLSQLLLGGVLGAAHRPGRPTAGDFGRDALSHLVGILGVGVWSLVLLAVAGGLLVGGWLLAAERGVLLHLLALLPGLLAWLAADTALDLARAARVRGDAPSALRCVLLGLRAAFRRPISAAVIHVGYGLLGLLPFAVLLGLPDTLDAGGSGWVLLAFLLRQVAVVLRTAARIASLGSHLALMRAFADERQPRSERGQATEGLDAAIEVGAGGREEPVQAEVRDGVAGRGRPVSHGEPEGPGV